MDLGTEMKIPLHFPFGKPSTDAPKDHRQVAHTPITTGTSVIGIKFDKGVILASDMLGSYGSLAKFRMIERLVEVNKQIVIGAGGDYADFQFLRDIIKQKVTDESCLDDGFLLKPRSLHSWVTRFLYNRRNRFDPLWTNFVVAGMQDGEPFLGVVDKLGKAYESDCVGTGLGSHIAIPYMRNELEKKANLTEQEAREAVVKSLHSLFYRDARAFDKYQLATITAEGVKIETGLTLETDWSMADISCGTD
ncbi:proteasome subunit beta type-4 [Nilaparvata lugens]|uniref:proteasome subunit beta type-4 n=1 Tax=Nilaparvata lugens TaxID=108931 RepID=UPI00193D32EE|nr:proteasome subunit beta type-4 [Nilaparvata lugens]